MLPVQSQSLRPLTTAHLAQTMFLLELNSGELKQKVEAELAANPALELGDMHRCPICGRYLANPGACPTCVYSSSQTSDQPIVFVSPRSESMPSRHSMDDDEMNLDDWALAEEELPIYVLQQIITAIDPEDRYLAAYILNSLDEDGLLINSVSEIARYHHVPLTRVERIQHVIQRADPIGIGSANPQEALLVQIEVLAETQNIPPGTTQAVQNGLELLSRKNYMELAKLLGLAVNDVVELASFIARNLNPYPARAHWGEQPKSSQDKQRYGVPDIIISHLNNSIDAPLVVEIFSPYSGIIRVNPLFKEAISQVPTEKSEEWQSALDQATLLVKCIQQRNHTLVRLMTMLTNIQKEFILYGNSFMKPITRANLAEELEVHESTVSRAVSAKSVQLPNGRIIPLSKLFDRSLNVRTAMKQIIVEEAHPLSDTEIADRLSGQGFPIARRTVAKYRAMEGILPSRMRLPAQIDAHGSA